jgi:hypothetical protein
MRGALRSSSIVDHILPKEGLTLIVGMDETAGRNKKDRCCDAHPLITYITRCPFAVLGNKHSHRLSLFSDIFLILTPIGYFLSFLGFGIFKYCR